MRLSIQGETYQQKANESLRPKRKKKKVKSLLSKKTREPKTAVYFVRVTHGYGKLDPNSSHITMKMETNKIQPADHKMKSFWIIQL